MRNRVVSPWVVGAAAAVFAACAGEEVKDKPTDGRPAATGADEANVVARVGDGAVTLETYRRKLHEKARALHKSPLALTEEERRAVVDELVQEEVLFQHGLATGVAAQDAFLRRRIVNLVMENEGKASGRDDVPEEELRRYYEENRDRYRTEEMVRASHILIKIGRGSSEADRQQALQKARFVRAEILKDPNRFAELSKKYSEGPSASRGGDLGYFTRDRMVKEFSEAAFGLAPGQVSDVIETTFGYHVIKVEDRRPAQYEPFERARRKVLAEVVQRRKDDGVGKLVADLKARHPVKLFEERMGKALEGDAAAANAPGGGPGIPLSPAGGVGAEPGEAWAPGQPVKPGQPGFSLPQLQPRNPLAPAVPGQPPRPPEPAPDKEGDVPPQVPR
jgi:parvulin-like peptidyl-prolyl isomerase